MIGKGNFFYGILTASLWLVACEKEAAKTPHIPPTEVSIKEVQPQTVPAVYEFVGVAQSSHVVEIRARIEGYLDKIAYTEGTFVQKGDLLFQIDPRPFEAALDRAHAQLAREEAILWDAKRAVERYRPLYEQKAASLRDLDNAVSHQLASEADVQAAKAQVTEAELNLGYTSIYAPVGGQAGQANYREGALISPSQDKMATLSVIDPIWINFSVSEGAILKSQKSIAQGRLKFPPNDDFTVQVVLADQTVFPEAGRVNFASPTYDQKTGTMMIRAVLPNRHSILRPGQFVRVRLLGAVRPDAIVVPQKAVLQSQKGMFVFIVNDENEAVMQPIEPGAWEQDNWVIDAGLKPGDRVIVEGVNKLRPGAKVVIKKDPLVGTAS
ncbi:multidrug-efflux transport protein acrA [Candidatus Protochlamydia naegleriophila]|uniref:Multidrug-efflux transport protein acrA n=1 Tax=Candidatus Protochlamydia naegleriophila TaxID=389348 RepID=A0A0U5K5I0_9BACT|nr:efflux RND transporter periplasmic adaptor subunit [Candidatus Protochlamydia naegleriophila]CUI17371.1 multidrug-efflux transport protein acrA [Candidatus Protochlamydia naegleriophila]